MKKLSDIDDDAYLCIVDRSQKYFEDKIMCKEEFMQSHYYLERDDAKVYVATERYATFSLYYSLECLADDMHEDWLSNVMDSIPKDVRKRIEDEVNGYLSKEPTYYPGVLVDW